MSHSIDEFYTAYSLTFPRAKKLHVCCACQTTIRIGHVYSRTFTVFDGQCHSYIRCLRCEQIHAHLRDKGSGYTYPSEALDCGETYEVHWHESPPTNISALAFVLPDEAQTMFAVTGGERE